MQFFTERKFARLLKVSRPGKHTFSFTHWFAPSLLFVSCLFVTPLNGQVVERVYLNVFVPARALVCSPCDVCAKWQPYPCFYVLSKRFVHICYMQYCDCHICVTRVLQMLHFDTGVLHCYNSVTHHFHNTCSTYDFYSLEPVIRELKALELPKPYSKCVCNVCVRTLTSSYNISQYLFCSVLDRHTR